MEKKLFNSIGIRMAALVATSLLTGLSTSADTILIDQTFDSPFGPTQSIAYTYFGGDITNTAASVVAGAGTNGTSALEQTNMAAALGNGYGYAAVVYQETGLTENTNADPGAYTLSFDARTSDANANHVEIRLIDLNGGTLDTAPTPPGYGNDLVLNTTYTHYSMRLNDTAVWHGQNGAPPFNPATSQWQFLFQANGGGGGIPPAWSMDIDNIQVTMAGNAPPPPPVTIYPPVKVPQGLNLYAGTAVNSFYDRQEVASVQSTGLGWVGRATAGNPVSYSFTVNSAPTNSALASFQMYLVPNFPPSSANANAPDWFATSMVETFLVGNSTNAVLQFAYKVNEAAGNAMLLGNAPYTNAPGSWNGVTSPYYESGALGSVTNPGILGTWTVTFTSDSNVTLIAPNGTNTALIIPAYNAPQLAESSSFNVYLSMQAEDQGAMNQSFNYGNFAVTGVLNPFSDNFLADSKLNTNVWNNSVAISPANVFVSDGHQKLVTWSQPASGFALQDAGQISGAWNNLNQGPIPTLSGLFSQVVSSNELPAGNNVFFRLIKRTYSQLQVLLPGETNAPGTVSGKIGTPTPVNNSTDVHFTVNACDSTWNIVNASGDLIHLTSSTDPQFVGQSDAALANGTLQMIGDFLTTGSQTVTVTDTSNTNITAGVSSPVTVN
jgi:hypothetical protein